MGFERRESMAVEMEAMVGLGKVSRERCLGMYLT
jgi:hypothetical protein